jgi:hypothetical protein
MKNTFRRKDAEYENQSHIERKKKAEAQAPKPKRKEDKTFEYGLDDEAEMIDYERYIK